MTQTRAIAHRNFTMSTAIIEGTAASTDLSASCSTEQKKYQKAFRDLLFAEHTSWCAKRSKTISEWKAFAEIWILIVTAMDESQHGARLNLSDDTIETLHAKLSASYSALMLCVEQQLVSFGKFLQDDLSRAEYEAVIVVLGNLRTFLRLINDDLISAVDQERKYGRL